MLSGCKYSCIASCPQIVFNTRDNMNFVGILVASALRLGSANRGCGFVERRVLSYLLPQQYNLWKHAVSVKSATTIAIIE